ncbi:MAG TPA: class III extradiol ring-cleavage dioxygenase, partial [Usitatibacteraceae bacterium]|nr:class III extradiol ring-cleavage dioxygenase [Usitatibacteraceae bacterium]
RPADAMTFPSLFISHGAPTLALANNFFTHSWAELGVVLGRPESILVVSAHWDTPFPAVTAAARLETIHDFSGFPEELYRVRYSPPGATELGGRVTELLAAAGLPPATDPDRGIDHGGWVPLRWMYPDADIPVTQLSVQSARGTRHHLGLGRALAPLRAEGVLILASGGIVHNLGELDWDARAARPFPWAVAFNDWMAAKVEGGAIDELADYRRLAPQSERAHPTEDHLVPFFVALGAGGLPARRMALGFDMGSLGMDCYAFG